MPVKKGNIPWNKGKKGSQVAWNKGMKGTASQSSIDNLRAISIARRGTKMPPLSQECKDKMRKAHLGKKDSDQTRAKKKARVGEKSGNWKGGLTARVDYSKHRRALINGSGGSHTVGDWENLKAQYNWTCPCCGKQENTIRLTQDHIIPISKGGSDNIENIQPLCLKCNMQKFTKIIKFQVWQAISKT